MSCGITQGQGVTCDDLRRVGGVNKRAYVFNIEGIQYTEDVDGNFITIDLEAYAGLFKIESRKGSHSGGSTLVEQTPGGNKFYNHNVILKMFPGSPIDDQVIEQMAVAELGIILEDNNKRFFLYGTFNGMSASASEQNTGQAEASDIAESMTFIGSETDKPKRFNRGTYQDTKDYLDSLVV